MQTASSRDDAKPATQAEAVEHARTILSKDGRGRVVVHDDDGGVIEILIVTRRGSIPTLESAPGEAGHTSTIAQ